MILFLALASLVINLYFYVNFIRCFCITYTCLPTQLVLCQWRCKTGTINCLETLDQVFFPPLPLFCLKYLIFFISRLSSDIDVWCNQWFRYCMVLFAGIAAEALIYGEAEGGENDENLFRSICLLLEPPLSVAEVFPFHNWLLWFEFDGFFFICH